MSKAQRYRSKPELVPRDLGAYFKTASNNYAVNRKAHFRQHNAKTLLYTSKGTLDTAVGNPIYMPFGGELVFVKLNVYAAPTSLLEADILLNGVSVFTTGDTKPNIQIGSTYGHKQIVTKAHFAEDDYLQVQLVTTGSATGPLLVAFDFFSEA